MRREGLGWMRSAIGDETGATWSKGYDQPVFGAVAIMAFAAVPWLGYESWRLLFDPSASGAIDLGQRFSETRAWYRGEPVYWAYETASYPPASYVLLWPFVGWLPFSGARWLWAVVNVGALVSLMRMLTRESLAGTSTERAFVRCLPLALYGTGACLGNGQLIVPILPALVGGLLLACRGPATIRNDLTSASLILLALVKPSVAAPFFWIVVFVPGRVRPGLIAASGYGALTLVAAWFNGTPVVDLLRGFAENTRDILAGGSGRYSHGNLHSWLLTLGKVEWLPFCSLALLAGLGLWVFVHRKVDLWLLIGVAALVSRFWTYHGWYDDLLLVLPMITLLRLVGLGWAGGFDRWVAMALCFVSVLALLPPGGTYLFPAPWDGVYVAGQVLVWLSMLAFLLRKARLNNP